jgi:molecular chaperone DnaK (HSP70)
MSDWTLCIDFGTAFSKAAAAPTGAWAHFDPAQVRPLQLNQHDDRGNAFLLDSAVFVDEDRVLFGRAAIARADALAGTKRAALKSFKTLLSVSDLDRALNTNAPLSIDPHRLFQMRDLIVLYLAYLLAAVEKARALDPMIKGRITRRYAAPAWRGGDSAGLHTSVVRLFGEAEAFRASIGDALLFDAGIGLDVIAEQLPRAVEAAPVLEMGLIYEASAAAAYTSIGLDDNASHLLVVDMGAGTTDIAALARIGNRMFELPEARATLKQAGDFIDQVVANRALDAARWPKSTSQRSALWADLMRGMRDTKETLFEEGRAIVRHGDRVFTIALNDIEKEPDFRAFAKALKAAYEHAVAVVRDDASARRRRNIEAVAVGGGAAAPFIQALIASKNTRGARPRISPRPATPHWAHAPEFQGNLAPVFSQLAIAIGGALAPESMLAAGGALSPAATGQSDTPGERD